jgi:hypothetical protein
MFYLQNYFQNNRKYALGMSQYLLVIDHLLSSWKTSLSLPPSFSLSLSLSLGEPISFSHRSSFFLVENLSLSLPLSLRVCMFVCLSNYRLTLR